MLMMVLMMELIMELVLRGGLSAPYLALMVSFFTVTLDGVLSNARGQNSIQKRP